MLKGMSSARSHLGCNSQHFHSVGLADQGASCSRHAANDSFLPVSGVYVGWGALYRVLNQG